MKLWILRPAEGLADEDNPWEPWYDRVFGFVVRAEDEGHARKLADEESGDEKDRYEFPRRFPWLDSKYSTCEELLAEGAVGIVMNDTHSA